MSLNLILQLKGKGGGRAFTANLSICLYFGHGTGQAHNAYYKEGSGPCDGVAGQQRKTHTDYARTYSKLLEYLKINRSQSL